MTLTGVNGQKRNRDSEILDMVEELSSADRFQIVQLAQKMLGKRRQGATPRSGKNKGGFTGTSQ